MSRKKSRAVTSFIVGVAQEAERDRPSQMRIHTAVCACKMTCKTTFREAARETTLHQSQPCGEHLLFSWLVLINDAQLSLPLSCFPGLFPRLLSLSIKSHIIPSCKATYPEQCSVSISHKCRISTIPMSY